MKTISYPDKYQCEKCNALHSRKWVAEMCESYELPPSPISVGDEVYVLSRYDGYILQKVIAVNLKHTDHFNFDNDPDVIVYYHNKPEITKNVPLLEHIKIHYDGSNIYSAPHYWEIVTEDYIEICKDGSTSNAWYIDQCTLAKDVVWETDFSLLKGDAIIKFDMGNIMINHYTLEQINKYYPDAKIIAFTNTKFK